MPQTRYLDPTGCVLHATAMLPMLFRGPLGRHRQDLLRRWMGGHSDFYDDSESITEMNLL